MHACGSSRWVELMAKADLSTREAAHEAADRAFDQLASWDIREAMNHHPRIGERTAGAAESREQAGAASAGDEVKRALVDGNHAYEARFGHIYLVCATGKSGQELLDLLNARLHNDPETELKIAAEEQRKITHLRLDKLWDAVKEARS